MVSKTCNFSRIYLRTKSGTNVISSELNPREILLSDFEKVIYVKDLSGNMLVFLPNNDNTTSDSTTWSSDKIVEYITDYINDTFDIIDGGTF